MFGNTASALLPSTSLHWLWLFLITPESKVHSLQDNRSYDLWHHHLGHCSKNALWHANAKLKGIPSSTPPNTSSPCQGCQLGKAHEQEFPALSKWAANVLDLIHTDCYGPTPGTTYSMDLVNFSLSFLSYLIVSDFEPWGDSLRELTYLMPFTISQTHVCLMVNPILLNLILFLTVHFRAVYGYAATTHAHYTCSMLLFHSATVMWLHHIFNLCHACPRQYR